MKKAAEYRRHATECRKLATKAQNDQQRTHLLKMADNWESLALERERFVRDYPELTAMLDRGDDAGI